MLTKTQRVVSPFLLMAAMAIGSASDISAQANVAESAALNGAGAPPQTFHACYVPHLPG